MTVRPTDEELEQIQAAGEQQEMDRDQYANNAEIDNAGRWALYEAGFMAGIEHEHETRARVKAATQRLAIVNSALNEKLK